MLFPAPVVASGSALSQLNSLRYQLAADLERDAGFIAGEQAQRFVDKRVLPLFDFDGIAQRLVGPEWTGMNNWQRTQATRAIARHAGQRLAETISNAPDEAAETLRRVQLRPGKPAGDRRLARVFFGLGRLDLASRTFSVQLIRGGDRRWRLLDVQLLGNSTLAAYRQALQRQARKFGWRQAFQWLQSLGANEPT